jgi:hypothetical protein
VLILDWKAFNPEPMLQSEYLEVGKVGLPPLFFFALLLL